MSNCTIYDTKTQTKVAPPANNFPLDQLTVSQFLAPFFPNENEPIHGRVFQGKNYPTTFASCFTTTRKKLAHNRSLQTKLIRLNQTNGIYFVVNAGGQTDDSITRFNAVFCERDDIPISEQHALLDQSPLPTSIRVETRYSVHAYWLLQPGCSKRQWCEAVKQLIHYFSADPKNKNPSRVMRLPFFNHVEYGKEPKKITPVQFEPERRYTIEEILSAFPEIRIEAKVTTHPHPPKAGFKISDSDPLAGRYEQFKQWVVTQVETFRCGKRDKQGNYSTKCPLHSGVGFTSMYLLASGAIGCNNCGTGKEFLDACMRKLNLRFKNSKSNQFYYEKRGGFCVAA